MCRSWFLLFVPVVLLLAGCGEPPNKEMAEAQGAIDAARAAGAERFARAEFAAATAALARAQQAVSERDYRHALADALDSRERAQNAAREAADTKATVRGNAERLLAETGASLDVARRALAAATAAKVSARALAPHQAALTRADEDLQKAGAAVKADDYDTSKSLMADAKAGAEAVAAAVTALSTPQSSRRRR